MSNLHSCACKFKYAGGPPEVYCAHNTLDILEDVLDLCGWPDEDGPDE